jgi:hypothetical protein
MTAEGKVNASKVQVNDRIIVRAWFDAEGHERVTESATKTGPGVFVVRVITKTSRMVFTGRRQNRVYVIHTTAGSFEAAPIQTMWLAPEDAAGVKRALAEAVAEDAERTRLAEVAALDARMAANAVAAGQAADRLKAEREAGTYTPERFQEIVAGSDAEAPQAFLDTLPAYAAGQRGPVAEVAAIPTGVQGGAWLADELGITQRASIPGLDNVSVPNIPIPSLDACEIPAVDVRYRVTFDRIGRQHSVAPMEFLAPAKTTDPAAVLAEAVWRYAGKFLTSRDFEVIVNMATMYVSIEYGRFGSGTITVVPADA